MAPVTSSFARFVTFAIASVFDGRSILTACISCTILIIIFIIAFVIIIIAKYMIHRGGHAGTSTLVWTRPLCRSASCPCCRCLQVRPGAAQRHVAPQCDTLHRSATRCNAAPRPTLANAAPFMHVSPRHEVLVPPRHEVLVPLRRDVIVPLRHDAAAPLRSSPARGWNRQL